MARPRYRATGWATCGWWSMTRSAPSSMARSAQQAGGARRRRVVVADVEADDDERGAGGAQPGDVAADVGLGGHGDAGAVRARELVDVGVEEQLALAVGEQAHAQAAEVGDEAAAGGGGVGAGADGREAGARGVGERVGEAVEAGVDGVVVGELQDVEAGVGERARGGRRARRRRSSCTAASGVPPSVIGASWLATARSAARTRSIVRAEGVQEAEHLDGRQREVDLGGVAGEEQRRLAGHATARAVSSAGGAAASTSRRVPAPDNGRPQRDEGDERDRRR